MEIDKGGTKGLEMFESEPAMIGGDVKQVVVRISHILGNFQVPSRSGGSEVMPESPADSTLKESAGSS